MIKNKLDFLRKKPYIAGLFIIIFIFIIYLPTMNTYLMSDDFEWLNDSYAGWQNPAQFFELINNFFRPFVKFIYLVNYTLFKTDALFYNVCTVLIHVLNVLLIYILAFKITRRITPASLIALLYGSSALYSEVVLWSAGRPESLVLTFMLIVLILLYNLDNSSEKKQYLRHFWILFFTLGAAATKETWVLLPFLAVALLWLVKQTPFKTALKSTSGLFLLLIAYVSYFIILPKLTGAIPFTSYGKFDVGEAIKKFAYMIFKYAGLSKFSKGALWEIALVVMILAALTYWLIRRKNMLALYGLIWMLMTIAITLPIYHAPTRYHYIPLMGFWMLIVAWLEKDINDLIKKYNIKTSIALVLIAIPVFFYLAHQVIMLQWEIKDYHKRGATHKILVDMYLKIKDQLPQDRPVVFIDLGKRRAVDELVRSIEGYRKLLYARDRAIWQQVFLEPLANFAGDPFSTLMKTIPETELDPVFQQDFTALVFTDRGFFISEPYKEKLREFYRENHQLPYKVQALRFVPVKERK